MGFEKSDGGLIKLTYFKSVSWHSGLMAADELVVAASDWLAYDHINDLVMAH